MNKEIKQKWVDLLRNGGLRQGSGELNYKTWEGDECYCALGVLCLAANIPTRDEEGEENYEAVGELLKVKDRGKIMSDIWHLNDADKLTFPEIADYIEKNIPES